MESLGGQTDLEGLLYQEAPQPASSLALQQGVNLEQSLPGTAPVSVGTFSHPEHCQQLEGGQTEHLLAEGGENEGRNSLHTGADGASAGPAHVDHTSQLEETRMILSSGALDIAARRSLLLGRTKQRHVCHVCGRECPSKHKLKRHLSTHSEDRPFSCHVCGKSFKWTEYLQKHMRQQHSGGDVSPSNGTPAILNPSTSPPHSSPSSQHYQHASTSSVSVSTDHGTSMDVTMETLATSMGNSVDHDTLGDGSVFSTDIQQDGTSMQDVGDLPPQPPPTTDLLTQPQSIPPTEMIPVQPNPPTSLPETALPTASEVVAHLTQQFGISIPVSGTEQQLPLAEFHSDTGNEMTGLDQSAAALNQHLSGYSMVLNNTQPASQTNDVLSSMPPTYMEMHPAIYQGHPEMAHNVSGYHTGQQLGTGYQQLGTESLNMAAFQQSLSLPQSHAVSQSTAITASSMYSDTTTTSTYDSTTPTTTPTNIIIREDMNGGEERPAKRPRKECVDVGIQCEVGHETLVALREEEEQARSQGGAVYSQAELEIDASAIVSDSSNQQVLVLQQGGFHEGGERQYLPLEGNEGAVMEAGANMSSEGMMSPTDPLKDDKVVHKYPCEVDNCKKAYIHRKDLIRHMKIRHGVSPKKLEPVAMETPEKPYICSVGLCGRSYFHMKDLRRHQRQCHTVSLGAVADAVPDNMLETGMEMKSQLRYPCDFSGCARSYVHKKDLVRHKRLFHKDSSSKPSVPIPIRYTESELKRIRQDFKVEIDRMVDKIRLDSTGSTASTTSGGDDPPNSVTPMETEVTESESASGGTAPQVTESLNGITSTANAPEFHPSSLISSVASAIIESLPLSSNSTTTPHSEETSNATDLLAMQGTVVPEHHILQTLQEAPSQLVPPQPSTDQQEQQQPIVSEATPSIYSTTGNVAYNFATASGNSEYNFGETHPLSALQPTSSQDQHPSSADQYDPTAVLNTIATSNSNELQASSLQSVAQIFAPPTAPDTSELAQGSF